MITFLSCRFGKLYYNDISKLHYQNIVYPIQRHYDLIHSMQALKDLFLLDPEVTFLNHGSFGATPRPVFEIYQAWQRELEKQPVEFLFRRESDLLANARQNLASYINCEADDIVFFPNTTTALNMVARSLDLQPGDEILTTDHEYGALYRTWRFLCSKTGAQVIQTSIPLPIPPDDELIESFWTSVTARTRVIFISHITSETALILPIKEICRRARLAGILTIIDAAHVIGQIPIDLTDLDPDFYASNCHKWLCAPKGSAFLYSRKEVQSILEPLVVSWGYEAEQPRASSFIDYHEWQGTRDISAFLSVPAAIEFQQDHDWDSVRQQCHSIAVETRNRINALTGIPAISPPDRFSQMFSSLLPEIDIDQLKLDLYQQYKIEVPILRWNTRPLIRVSFQVYNDRDDANKLIEALELLLPA